jgi:hypothetical protein
MHKAMHAMMADLEPVGFAQLNRVWSASTIALPQLNHKKMADLEGLLHPCTHMCHHMTCWSADRQLTMLARPGKGAVCS